MARPRKNTVDYFPHDVHHRKTLKIIEHEYGIAGYGFWFKLLEFLGKTPEHFYHIQDDICLKFLASETLCDEVFCYKILDLLARLDAIDRELWSKKVIWSQKFINRISDAYAGRINDIPQKPNPKEFIAPETPFIDPKTPFPDLYPPKNPQSKVKERKGKERKEKPLVRTPENPEFGRLANLLFQKILDRHPYYRTPDFKNWCKQIRLMVETDKRNPEEIESVIEWCQQDSFWQNNILSTEKLRKQYDQLILKMRQDKYSGLNVTQRSILESEARANERRKANENQKAIV